MTFKEKESARIVTLKQGHEVGWAETTIPSKLKKFLTKNNACYVLITCGVPAEDGKMQVEMTYEGDANLAAYLIESAHEIMDESESLSEV